MYTTLAKRVRQDEEMLRHTTQRLLETAGVLLIAVLALLAVCAGILLPGR